MQSSRSTTQPQQGTSDNFPFMAPIRTISYLIQFIGGPLYKSICFMGARLVIKYSLIKKLCPSRFIIFSTISHLHFWAFIRCFCPKRLAVIHTFIHWWLLQPCKVLTSTAGTVLGSVYCPRTLSHAGESNQGPSNNKTLALPLSRSCPCLILFESST